MNWLILAAGAASGVICLIHVFAGGRHIAGPLLSARDLHDVPKYTQYYCWHLVTIVLAAMSLAFIYAAIGTGARDVAMVMGVIAAAFAVFGLIIVPVMKQSYREMPQGWLFVPVALLGIAGALQ